MSISGVGSGSDRSNGSCGSSIISGGSNGSGSSSISGGSSGGRIGSSCLNLQKNMTKTMVVVVVVVVM